MTKTKSYPQLKYIWLLAKKCQLSTDDLHFMVRENFVKTDGHLSRLTSYQAVLLINILKKMLNSSASEENLRELRDSVAEPKNYRLGRQPRDSIRPPMSQAQHDIAFQLASEINQLNSSEYPSVSDLLEKLARHHQAICFDTCTTRQAFRVICALKSIKQRLCH